MCPRRYPVQLGGHLPLVVDDLLWVGRGVGYGAGRPGGWVAGCQAVRHGRATAWGRAGARVARQAPSSLRFLPAGYAHTGTRGEYPLNTH